MLKNYHLSNEDEFIKFKGLALGTKGYLKICEEGLGS